MRVNHKAKFRIFWSIQLHSFLYNLWKSLCCIRKHTNTEINSSFIRILCIVQRKHANTDHEIKFWIFWSIQFHDFFNHLYDFLALYKEICECRSLNKISNILEWPQFSPWFIYKNPSRCTKKYVNVDCKVKFKYFGVSNSTIFFIIYRNPSCCAQKYACANHYAKFQNSLGSPTFTVFPRIYEHPLRFARKYDECQSWGKIISRSKVPNLCRSSLHDLWKKQLLLKWTVYPLGKILMATRKLNVSKRINSPLLYLTFRSVQFDGDWAGCWRMNLEPDDIDSLRPVCHRYVDPYIGNC